MRIQESFNTIAAISKRELSGYFESPVAYVFLVIFLLLLVTNRRISKLEFTKKITKNQRGINYFTGCGKV